MVREGGEQETIADCLPVIESCPNAIIVHFPAPKKDKLVWQGMYLTSYEAIELGMRIIENAEASLAQEHDS